jgi:hypothetical protein
MKYPVIEDFAERTDGYTEQILLPGLSSIKRKANIFFRGY